jgi:hypothetical protein
MSEMPSRHLVVEPIYSYVFKVLNLTRVLDVSVHAFHGHPSINYAKPSCHPLINTWLNTAVGVRNGGSSTKE